MPENHCRTQKITLKIRLKISQYSKIAGIENYNHKVKHCNQNSLENKKVDAKLQKHKLVKIRIFHPL